MDFVIIGGLAITLHGSGYVTSDLDIIYDDSRDNLSRLSAALQSLDVRLQGAEDVPLHVDARLLCNGDRFTFSSRFGPFDCMATADGAPSFARVRERAQVMNVGAHQVNVASLDDLIAMKKAAGRPKDLAMLDELVQLRQLIERGQDE